MEGPNKVKRIYVPIDYEDEDIDFYDDPGESIKPTISKIEPLKSEDILNVVPVKEVDIWILSAGGEVDDSAIADLIDMEIGTYREHMKKHFKAFQYINSLAIKKIEDVQEAADWINSQILIVTMAKSKDGEN